MGTFIKLSELKVNPKNPRLIKNASFEKLKKSLSEFPKMLELRPIIIDDENMILGGNMRYKALKDLKYKELPEEWVKRVSELTEEEKKRFIIEDNLAFGEWDFDVLSEDWDKDELSEWGIEFDDNEGKKKDTKEDEYQASNNINTDIQYGDLFQIGNHRLLCGDAMNSDAKR